jgi:tyrosine-protein kinase Etk/Wzc
VNKFLLFLWGKKTILISCSIVIFIWSFISAFFLTIPEFKSEVTFLPPHEGSASAVTLMGMLLPGGTSIMYDQVEILFNSAALKRRIIDNFNFYKLWKIEKFPDRFEVALQKIKKYVLFKTAVKGSMGFEKIVSYTVSCYHPCPDTAKLMCDFAFFLIDSAVKNLSTNMAHRNRLFIENQLFQHKKILDSLQQEFQRFQLAKKAFVVPEQMRMSLKNYAEIKSAAILNDLRMKSLQEEFHGTLPQLEELQKNDFLYNEKLNEIESSSRLDVLPSLELSARLLPEYTNLSRESAVEDQVIVLLSRELEQARVQESRNVSLLTVVDPAYVPVHKARPKRLFIMALIFISLNFAILVMLGYQFYISTIFKESKALLSLQQMLKSAKR